MNLCGRLCTITFLLWIPALATSVPNNPFESPNKIKSGPTVHPQIQITAQIVYADHRFTNELGITFSSVNSASQQDSNGLAMDLPIHASSPGHVDLAITHLGNNALLNLELAALESEGRGQVIARPKLVTNDNTPAYIESGEEVPYQEKTASGATNISFKKAVLSLTVTPTLMTSGKIQLKLAVHQDKISPLNFNGAPVIQTRKIETTVQMKANETLVLGGIYEQTRDRVLMRIPFFSRIPLIGALFRKKSNSLTRKELLIFVSPKQI